MKSKLFRSISLLIVLSVFVMSVGCATQDSNTSAAESPSAEASSPSQEAPAASPVKLRFGLLPYQDWMPWMLAEELGYFDEVGIDLEVITFTDDVTCAEAIASGDIDIGCGNSGSGPLILSRFSQLRLVSLTCGFLGYSIMVRPDDLFTNGGTVKTYEMLYEEEKAAGVTDDEAVQNAITKACAQLKGKEIVMDRGTGSNLPFAAALEAAGLSATDVNYIDIPDVEGALAFWDGTGDFEIGGFPQALSLGELGASKLISAAELGGKSVCLSSEMATQDYVDKNMDTIVKMRQVWYRVINDIYSTDTSYMQKLADIANKYQGTSMTADDMRNVAFAIDPWPTQDEVQDVFFAADGKWNMQEIYGASLDYWINIKGEVAEGTVDLAAQDKLLREIHSKVS